MTDTVAMYKKPPVVRDNSPLSKPSCLQQQCTPMYQTSVVLTTGGSCKLQAYRWESSPTKVPRNAPTAVQNCVLIALLMLANGKEGTQVMVG